MNFIKTNPHPEGKKTGDCVVRAIAIAENKKWIEVYDKLSKVGREIFDMPNMKRTYEKYLLDNGWTKQRMPKHQNGRRYTLRQLADEISTGTVIVSVAKHLVTVKDGDLYDAWDCSKKCVGNYYTRFL